MPLAAAGLNVLPACEAQATPTLAQSKSAAILGQPMSALERMKLQQSGAAVPEPAAATPMAPCATSPFAARTQTGAFFGTERVAIGKTRFDKHWKRAMRKDLSRRDAESALGALPQDRDALLARVNGWVNNAIAYRSDGRRDRWADAKSTLRKRYGDCEDYAILKLQLLAAAGVREEDMMLTLARDTVRRVDHAVLLVRTEGAFGQDDWVMLDMQSDRVLSARYDYGYRPVMSFGGGKSYLHGRAVGPRIAYR